MPEILQRLGDALAGVDRTDAFIQGQQDRADLDYRRNASRSAFELARQRQAEARKAQEELEIMQALREADFSDPNALPMGDIVVGNYGTSFAGAQQGRLRGQEYLNREAIADPMAPGPDRVRAAQAVSPNALAASGLGDELEIVVDPNTGQPIYLPRSEAAGQVAGSRLPGYTPPELLEITVGPDGTPIYTPRSEAAGQPVGARPSNRQPGSEALVIVQTPEGARYVPRSEAAGQAPGARPTAASGSGAGGINAGDSNTIYRQAAGLFGGIYDPATETFTELDPRSIQRAQAVAARAGELFAAGGIDHATAVSRAFAELQQTPGWAENPLGLGDELEGEIEYQEGDIVSNPATGERLQLRGGQWVEVQ